MNTKYLFVILISFLMISCSQNEKKEEKKKEEKSENKEEHDHEHEEKELHLNDGAKWKVNIETSEGIQDMKEEMSQFDPNSGDEAYLALHDSLDADFRYIFKMCTAEGEAHDQLHVLLFPLRGMFQRLKEPEDAVRKTAVENINKQLGLYSTYFE